MGYYAKIESDVVVSVDVVTDRFFNAHPSRYPGRWYKVGDGARRYCGIGWVLISDNIVPPQPFASWTLVGIVWTPPTPRPGRNYYWDEPSLTWKEF